MPHLDVVAASNPLPPPGMRRSLLGKDPLRKMGAFKFTWTRDIMAELFSG